MQADDVIFQHAAKKHFMMNLEMRAAAKDRGEC